MKTTLTWLPVKTRSRSSWGISDPPAFPNLCANYLCLWVILWAVVFRQRNRKYLKNCLYVVHELLTLNTQTAYEIAFATCLTHVSKLNQFILFSACGLVSQQGWMPLKDHTELIKKAPSCHWWILNGFNTFGELPHACAGLQTERRCEGAGWGGRTTGSESVAGISCKGSALRVRGSWQMLTTLYSR